jgi:hypothetical protein
MALTEEPPPSIAACPTAGARPFKCACGTGSCISTTGEPRMPFIHAAGIFKSIPASPPARAGPRSSISTRAPLSFTSRHAATQPAEPPPTMM